ncbi:MAG TPA: hypothetical protein VGX76_03460, partial [Pirellulales bacterium]|nr:hypothetical protein [Pirellulales bacterium]
MNPISTSSPFARQNDASSARDLTVGTLWRFLRGDHDAILSVASARGALRLGLLFVVSAALAREYD